jgi:hypothetical protein
VAERALLAQELPDGSYSVRQSQWGGSDRALAAVCAGTPPAALPDVEWHNTTAYHSFRAVVASLDVLTTAACYRVVDGDVTVFLPLWFGLPLADVRASPTIGALVAVDSLAEVRAIRWWFRSVKGRVADAVLAGDISWSGAVTALAAAIDTLPSRERYLCSSGTAERLSARE